MPHDDFEIEPVEGLPEQPPQGEEILWQGRPHIFRLAREAFKIGWITLYFAIVVLWRGTVGFNAGGAAGAIAFALPYTFLWAGAMLVLLALAFIQAKSTVYTVTSARVVMRIGAALNITFNFPFRQVDAADLALRKDGTGTIALQTTGDTKFSYLILWPHCRPGFFTKPQPALRCIPDAKKVAGLLAEAAEARVSEPVLSREMPLEPGFVAAE